MMIEYCMIIWNEDRWGPDWENLLIGFKNVHDWFVKWSSSVWPPLRLQYFYTIYIFLYTWKDPINFCMTITFKILRLEKVSQNFVYLKWSLSINISTSTFPNNQRIGWRVVDETVLNLYSKYNNVTYIFMIY